MERDFSDTAKTAPTAGHGDTYDHTKLEKKAALHPFCPDKERHEKDGKPPASQ